MTRHEPITYDTIAASFSLSAIRIADCEPGALGPPSRIWSQETDWDSAVRAFAVQFAQAAGHSILSPHDLLYVRNRDETRIAMIILHRMVGRDAELIVCATPGIGWTRTVVCGIARWAFLRHDLGRLTARVRNTDVATLGYVQRLGFKFEGRQRKYFADDVDASLWGMTRDECPWFMKGL